jgi:hypothetical protein
MPTLLLRTPVSLALTTAVALLLVGCGSSRTMRTGPAGTTPASTRAVLDLRFDNEARDRVHVYLLGARREWLLGRVEPGAIATLRVPEAALVSEPGLLRLAVVIDERVTLRAEANPRAITTLAQPLGDLLTHRWRYQPGHLTPRGRR